MTDIQSTLEQRGNRYGDFREQARVAQSLKEAARNSAHWDLMPPYVREGLDLILNKISRMVTGDWTYTDNPHDIVGYAKLIEDRLIADNANPDGVPVMMFDPTHPDPELLMSILLRIGIAPSDFGEFAAQENERKANV